MKEQALNFIKNLKDSYQSPTEIPREVRHSEMQQLRNEICVMQYSADLMGHSDQREPDYEAAGHTMALSYMKIQSILESNRISEFLSLENNDGRIQLCADPQYAVTHKINTLNIGSPAGNLVHEVLLFTKSLPESVRIQEIMGGEPQVLFDASNAPIPAMQKESAGES